MLLSEILEQAQKLENQLDLKFDTPASVKLQIKQIAFTQKQLRVLKKGLNATIREINQVSTQTGVDSILSVELDVFGSHKWAGKIRAETRRAIERQRHSDQPPYREVKDVIDSLILEGDRLKLEGEQYVLNDF